MGSEVAKHLQKITFILFHTLIFSIIGEISNTASSSLIETAAVRAKIPSTQEDPRNPDWRKYHDTAATHALLLGWTQVYPKLTNLYSIGMSLEGTPLLVMEITNKDLGSPSEKPGYYYDGNIHAGELASAEVILYFAWQVLSNYGKDSRITRILDTRTLYLRPKFNPDGADLAMSGLHNLRSTPRPYDEDRDAFLDEDPPNDLNGDGHITLMRVKDSSGRWAIHPDDNRIMIAYDKENETGERYTLITEGIDDDGDGRFNEDGIGGIDMNRNFSRNWGMEFEQQGAGPYPLSEPETRDTVEFLNKHRNITGVFHGHTSGGFLFRLPSTTSWDDFHPFDQKLILELSLQFQQTTDQPVRPSYSNPRVHRYGTLISWAYWDYGVVGFVPEFWGGFGRDYNHDGTVTESERLQWNQEELEGKGFCEWEPCQHPQLGMLEIGGWRTRFTRQNPPPHFLKSELELYVPWMLWLAEISPRVVIRDIVEKPLGAGKTSITVTVENEGYLATNITQRAINAKIAVPTRVYVELKDAEMQEEKQSILGHLPGTRDRQSSSGNPEFRHSLEYTVTVTGPDPVMTIKVVSQKGGTTYREVRLNQIEN